MSKKSKIKTKLKNKIILTIVSNMPASLKPSDIFLFQMTFYLSLIPLLLLAWPNIYDTCLAPPDLWVFSFASELHWGKKYILSSGKKKDLFLGEMETIALPSLYLKTFLGPCVIVSDALISLNTEWWSLVSYLLILVFSYLEWFPVKVLTSEGFVSYVAVLQQRGCVAPWNSCIPWTHGIVVFCLVFFKEDCGKEEEDLPQCCHGPCGLALQCWQVVPGT